MKKIFKNVGGNQFKLLTESISDTIAEEKHTRQTLLLKEAIKKIFTNGGSDLKYSKIENMGIGFISNIFEAKKCALQEARLLAEEFGYKDDSENQKFIKEDEHDRLDPEQKWTKVPQSSNHDESNPQKNRTVQIGKEILNRTQHLVNIIPEEDWEKYVTPIQSLANELIQMHSAQ